MTKKIISFLLAMLLVLSALPALGEEHGPLWIEGGEGVTLTYWTPLWDPTVAQTYTTLAEHPFFIWLEEQTGVHIEFIHPSIEQMDQQFNLMLTSNNFYDLLFAAEYPDGAQAAIDDGVFVDLNTYMDLMPDYYAAVTSENGSFGNWEWGEEKALYDVSNAEPFIDRTLTAKGNMWCATQVWSNDVPVENGAIIRQDWLDDAGLSMPQTLEDLEKTLAAFKARGEDVIPMSLGNMGYNGISGFLVSAWDLNPSWWTVTDGTVDPHGFTTPEFKEYLTLMNKWYDLGYIDPDFMNRDDTGLISLFLQDRLGIMVDTYYTDYQMDDMYQGSEAFDAEPMPLPRMSTDQQLHLEIHYESRPTNYTVLTTNCKTPEIAAQWLNALFKKETILRASYGVEGETYEMNENGVPYFTEGYFTMDYEVPWLYTYPSFTGYNSIRAGYLSDMDIADYMVKPSNWARTSSVWGANADYSKNIGSLNFPGESWSEMYNMYIEAETYAAPMVIKFITGNEPLDKFDEFAQKVLDMGMAEARDLTQEAYDAQIVHTSMFNYAF